MSDTMLHGILNMPPELWRDDEADKMQRHGRYKQASRRIEDLEAALAGLIKKVEECDGWESFPSFTRTGEEL